MADHVEHAPAVQASADGHPAKRARVEDDDGHPGVHSAVSNVGHRCDVGHHVPSHVTRTVDVFVQSLMI